MSRLDTLRAARSIHDLAALLNFRPQAVSYILFKEAPETKYREFLIPKRSGGHRRISAPHDALKRLQRNLSDLLQGCLDELHAEKRRSDTAVHGFRRGHSIIDNAYPHRRRRYILNVDLENYFPSINFGRVRGYFINDRDFRLDATVATLIAQIACNGDVLPQGGPSSPVIANMVTRYLDLHLIRLARDVGCTYSRYADDLTFSTNKKDFPSELALLAPSADNLQQWTVGASLRAVLERSGFKINEAKTRMMYKSSRQEVTGLVVNNKVSVRAEYRRYVRAMVHRYVTTGQFQLWGAVDSNGASEVGKVQGTPQQLHGMLGFIDSIDRHNHKTARGSQGRLSSEEAIFADFCSIKSFLRRKVR